jgi:serine/threonine-protein kinase
MTVVHPERATARLPENDFRAESPAESDSLDAFKTEDQLKRAAAAKIRQRQALKIGAVVLACIAVVSGSWLVWQNLPASKPVTAPPQISVGTAVFTTVPDGASVVIDGVDRGKTPIKVSLASGPHTVVLTSGDITRTLPLTVEAGAVMSQYVELAAQAQMTGGRLEIGSDPPGAEVRVDGVVRGITPLAIADIAVGPHRVSVSSGESVVNRTVTVTRGMTAAVVVSTGAPQTGAAAGYLTIAAPFEIEVFEGQRMVGTTRSDRLMLPVGSHDLDLSNSALEFTAKRNVKIVAGKTTDLAIALPMGKLSINAVPWADVSIDGRAAGTTPLGNLSVPVGTHEIVFRNPQLGERRQTVTVKSQTPTRIGVDLSK